MFSQSHIIKLTVVLYKVSDFFPDKEPLKVLIRKKADEVLAGLILLLEQNYNLTDQVASDIEVIKAYIELAKLQNWLRKENFELLEKEYNLILEKIKSMPVVIERKEIKLDRKEDRAEKIIGQKDFGLEKKRCVKIIEILKKGKPIQVKDLKDVFPDVSKRTLRRDFEYLFEKGLVERLGDNNSIEYMLKK